MKKVIILIGLLLILTGCRNPFYDYPDNYSYVQWTSTKDSDINIDIYVLEQKYNYPSLIKLYHNNEEHNFVGYIDHYLYFEEIDEYGYNYDGESRTINCSFSRIVNGVYSTVIVSDTIFNELKGQTIILEKTELKIEPYMFTKATYTNEEISTANKESQYLVSSGTLLNNNINLKFFNNNTFIITEYNNINNIYYEGICEYNDGIITLYINKNNLDNKEIIKLNVET